MTAAVEGVRRIGRNIGALLLAYALPRLATLGAAVVAARVLGAADFGAYGTAASFAVILSVVATAGMMPLLVRDLARAPGDATLVLRAAHRVKTATSVAMLGVLLVVGGWLLDFPQPVLAAALLLGISYAVGAYAENLAAYFQAVERMHVWSEASAIFGLTTGTLGLALVVTTRSVVWFSIAPIIGQMAALAWLVRRLPPSGRVPRDESGDASGLLRRALPFAAAFLALSVYYKVDVLLLARWRSPDEVGLYTAAYRFFDVAQALAIVVVSAVYPRLARAAPASEGGRWAGTRLIELALLVAVPVAAMLWFVSDALVIGLFGAEYAGAAPALGLLFAALPALVVNILAGYMLGVADRMAPVALLYAGGAALNIAANAWLIGTHGAAGAALVKLFTEILLAMGFVLVLRVRAFVVVDRSVLATAGLAVLMAPVVGVATQALSFPGRAAGAAALYGLAVVLLYARAGAISSTERRLVSAALRRSEAV